MANINMVAAASLWLLIGTHLVTGLNTNVNEKSPLATLAKMSKEMGSMLIKEWDISKLGNALLNSVITNGIPALNISSLDPLKLEGNLTLDLPALPGVIDLDYSDFSNIVLINLKSAYFAKLTVLPSLKVIVDLEIPEIHATGEWYNFSGIIGDLIPFYGFGNLRLTAGAGVLLNVTLTRTSQKILQMSDLEVDLILHKLVIHFSNLMGGEGEIFNELIGDLAGDILDLVKPAFFPDLIVSIQTLINDFLLEKNVTLEKLIQCALFPDKCFLTAVLQNRGTSNDVDVAILKLLGKLGGDLYKGIANLGIPPMDPYNLEHYTLKLRGTGSSEIKIALDKTTIRGLSNFTINHIYNDLEHLKTDYSFTIPLLSAKGQYEVSGHFADIQLFGKGPIIADIEYLTAWGTVKVGSEDNSLAGKVFMESISVNFILENMRVNMENLMGGGILGNIMNEIISKQGPTMLQKYYKPELEKLISKTVINISNPILHQFTLREILDCLGITHS